jgi:hypothetical protein
MMKKYDSVVFVVNQTWVVGSQNEYFTTPQITAGPKYLMNLRNIN